MSERTSWYCCAECDRPSTREDRIEDYAIADSETGTLNRRTWQKFHPACIPAANKKLIDGFEWAPLSAVEV